MRGIVWDTKNLNKILRVHETFLDIEVRFGIIHDVL